MYHLHEWTLVSQITKTLSAGCTCIVLHCVVWPIEGTDAGLSMTVDDTDDEMEFTSLSSNLILRRKWLGSGPSHTVCSFICDFMEAYIFLFLSLCCILHVSRQMLRTTV